MYFFRSTVAVTIIFIKGYQWTKPVSKEKVKTYLILTSFASQKTFARGRTKFSSRFTRTTFRFTAIFSRANTATLAARDFSSR